MANLANIAPPGNNPTSQAPHWLSRIKVGRLIMYLVLLQGIFLAALPFFWMVSTSLMTLGETINRQWLPKAPQIQNYLWAWERARFERYFMNSVIITFVTLAGLLFTSILAAYAFARIHFVGRNIIFGLLLATMM